MKNNIAVVGSIDSILAFKAVGFDVFGLVDSHLFGLGLNRRLNNLGLDHALTLILQAIDKLGNRNTAVSDGVVKILGAVKAKALADSSNNLLLLCLGTAF